MKWRNATKSLDLQKESQDSQTPQSLCRKSTFSKPNHAPLIPMKSFDEKPEKVDPIESGSDEINNSELNNNDQECNSKSQIHQIEMNDDFPILPVFSLKRKKEVHMNSVQDISTKRKDFTISSLKKTGNQIHEDDIEIIDFDDKIMNDEPRNNNILNSLNKTKRIEKIEIENSNDYSDSDHQKTPIENNFMFAQSMGKGENISSVESSDESDFLTNEKNSKYHHSNEKNNSNIAHLNNIDYTTNILSNHNDDQIEKYDPTDSDDDEPISHEKRFFINQKPEILEEIESENEEIFQKLKRPIPEEIDEEIEHENFNENNHEIDQINDDHIQMGSQEKHSQISTDEFSSQESLDFDEDAQNEDSFGFHNFQNNEEIDSNVSNDFFHQQKVVFEFLEEETNDLDVWLFEYMRVFKVRTVDSQIDELTEDVYRIVVRSRDVSHVKKVGDHFVMGVPYHLYQYNNNLYLIAPCVTDAF
ncbi:hypothetical protein TRFO_33862 [Tritrichomonas foetus]|uniref:Uncharacterized protein n=1 Tax=Tritrichomonas foetus TaxID=1144522 RepID=A0A1J4JQ25_9EUKA|nr:hypothetical protein TRFO_33862 [Tritrichomonas foetus]|eukprot:OHS99629.1 hypothetical protein TRFO_33862 [Tritrichomonas foetus]